MPEVSGRGAGRLGRRLAWGAMAFAALAVAGYALAMVMTPGLRGEFVVAMFRDEPLAAPAHLAGGAVAMLAGALQFAATLRRRHLPVHRWLGRVYVVAVAVSGTAGFSLALTTSGGAPARFGFAAMALCWLLTTGMAFMRILQRDVSRHQVWMVRSYALTLAAVSLRLYLPLGLANGVAFESVYAVVAWLCWVPNLLLAEWLVLPLLQPRRRAAPGPA